MPGEKSGYKSGLEIIFIERIEAQINILTTQRDDLLKTWTHFFLYKY